MKRSPVFIVVATACRSGEINSAALRAPRLRFAPIIDAFISQETGCRDVIPRMKTRFSPLPIRLIILAAAFAAWALWIHKRSHLLPLTYQSPVYDESAAEQDYAAGRKRFLVYGLNTSRSPLPTALLERGVTYTDVGGCVPPINAIEGIAAYNRRMKDLLQQDTSLDLRDVADH